jgi:hypothetical protein
MPLPVSLHLMPHLSITRLYDLLAAKLGKETAENLAIFIEEKITKELENKSQILATKGDLASLKEGFANLKEDFALLKGDFATLKGELKSEMAANKAETIKWMFLFWIGQVVATFGFILLFLKK